MANEYGTSSIRDVNIGRTFIDIENEIFLLCRNEYNECAGHLGRPLYTRMKGSHIVTECQWFIKEGKVTVGDHYTEGKSTMPPLLAVDTQEWNLAYLNGSADFNEILQCELKLHSISHDSRTSIFIPISKILTWKSLPDNGDTAEKQCFIKIPIRTSGLFYLTLEYYVAVESSYGVLKASKADVWFTAMARMPQLGWGRLRTHLWRALRNVWEAAAGRREEDSHQLAT